MDQLLLDPDLNLVRFLTTTTRDPREGEHQGVEYQFLSPALFKKQAAAGTFFEWTEIYGHFYGTNKETLQTLRQGSRPIICVLELEGAKKIKQADPERTSIVLIEANRETLTRRLRERHTDAADVAKRLERIDRELHLYPLFADIKIENNDGVLADSVNTIKQLILKTMRVHFL